MDGGRGKYEKPDDVKLGENLNDGSLLSADDGPGGNLNAEQKQAYQAADRKVDVEALKELDQHIITEMERILGNTYTNAKW